MLMLAACGRGAVPSAAPSGQGAGSVIRVEGERLVAPDGSPLVLRGVAFGNRVWAGDRIPRRHHDQRDFARVAELGMNAVRFYMNYRTFESDAAPGQWLSDGWQWLDDNIAWAKRHRIYLVLNMHVPPGGFQSLGQGKALWNDPKTQDRLVVLWRAIAERYAREPIVAGYDLVNEPVVPKNIGEWKALAERIIAAIREVDPAHAIFVERVNAIAGDWKENSDRNFFRVRDPNVVYEFHFYKPFHFTHQNASWAESAPEKARYPDENVAEVEWFHLTYRTGTLESPKLPAGDSDWKYYQGQPFVVTDPSIAVGRPSLLATRVGAGRVLFDDLVLERVDGTGKTVETLWRVNLDTLRGFYFWKQRGDGTAAFVAEGHGDASALSITGTIAEAHLGADFLRFRPRVGSTYRLSGWMRGERIPEQAVCQLRLDFSSSTVPVHARDRAFLEQELDAYVSWGKRERVPLFLGEFGAIKYAFEDDRGGLRWVNDMLDLLLERQLSFTYHDYHEDSMGIFIGDKGLPDPNHANQPLLDLFRQKLALSPADASVDGD
jgi:endoglucanase